MISTFTNSSIDSKYMGPFIDGLEYYIDITEIDNVDIILLWKNFDACENIIFFFVCVFYNQFRFGV